VFSIRWQKEFFENGAAAFSARAARTNQGPNSNGSKFPGEEDSTKTTVLAE